jgi:hypothetical protein
VLRLQCSKARDKRLLRGDRRYGQNLPRTVKLEVLALVGKAREAEGCDARLMSAADGNSHLWHATLQSLAREIWPRMQDSPMNDQYDI